MSIKITTLKLITLPSLIILAAQNLLNLKTEAVPSFPRLNPRYHISRFKRYPRFAQLSVPLKYCSRKRSLNPKFKGEKSRFTAITKINS